MFIAYCRVSTDDTQTVDNQLHAIKQAYPNVSIMFKDEGVSGTTAPFERKGFGLLASLAKPGDTIVFFALDRVGRSRSTYDTIQELIKRGVNLVSVTEAEIKATTADEKFLVGIRCEVAAYERNRISERTKAALQRIKSEGKQLGRPAKIDSSVIRSMVSNGMTKQAIADALNIGVASVYRALKTA